jgi:hypothetical protein
MEALLAFWQANGAIILAVLGVVIGLATYVARGEGKELARLTVEFVLRLSGSGWDLVTEKQVRDLAGLIYDGAYNWTGPPWFRVIPWRLWINRENVQDWAWQAFCKAHSFFDSHLATATLQNAQAAKVVPKGLTL